MSDPNTVARRQYFKVFFPSMLIYLIGVFAVTYLWESTETGKPLIYGLSVIPVAAILTWMWAHWHYVKRLDEYLRRVQTEAMMIGLMIVVALAGGWGLLELMLDLPAMPIFYVMPGFYFVYGLAYVVLARREGIKGAC